LAGGLLAAVLGGQSPPPLDDQEKNISERIGQLRSLPDEQWTKSVGELAAAIQGLRSTRGKLLLVSKLGNLVTEGDAGQATLQRVASTMADLLRAMPNAQLYATLAQLAHYEHCQVTLDSAPYREALAKLQADDKRREAADFRLRDLRGAEWSVKQLRGKVVMVNFWATWCPPCRKEMPDLEALHQRFGPRGLVILAISDEAVDKVSAFIHEKTYSYPILLDPEHKAAEAFAVQGIPKTYVFDREGKLAAQAMDRRTERQFLAMLKRAGLE